MRYAFIPLCLVVACATAKPPSELVQARATYADASAQAAAAAPSELRDAELALDDAEAAFQKDPDSLEVRDRAYVAERRAEIAIAKAHLVEAERREQASDARIHQLSATASEQLRATRQENSVDQERVRDLEQKTAELQTELEQQKVESAEKGQALENTQQQLENEQEARQDAEQRLTTTLQGVRDLQSVQEEPRGLVITLSGQVLFASGKFELLSAAMRALDNVADALKSGDRSITVEGYTDSQGSPASNLVLSQARAESVRRYLIERGVPDDKIVARGMGEDSPVAPNTSVEGRANNRRVEIVVAPAKVEPR